MRAAYQREDIVASARGWIGTPYKHQASLKTIGSDCLGLIRGVFRELEGHEPEVPPPYSADWAEAPDLYGQCNETMALAAGRHLREIPVGLIQPGDVLLFRMTPQAVAKHAAILSGPNTMIHACSGRAVTEVSFADWWRRRLAHAYSFPGIEN